MTCGEMADRVLKEVGVDPLAPVYYHHNEAVDALNEAQRFFALLTLCLESTGSVALEAAITWYDMLGSQPDMGVVVRVSRSTGEKLRPCRITDLDARGATWQGEAGNPVRYAVAGPLLAIHPRPAINSGEVVLLCSRMPARMTADSAVPEVPAEYHPDLIDYAVYRLRMKEGGQEFVKELPRFQSFMAAAKKMADYVRRRNGGGAYDRLPFELEVTGG